jgi:hypothetical protein
MYTLCTALASHFRGFSQGFYERGKAFYLALANLDGLPKLNEENYFFV